MVLFSGAKTVNGPAPDNTLTRSPSAAPKAATRLEKLELFKDRAKHAKRRGDAYIYGDYLAILDKQ